MDEPLAALDFKRKQEIMPYLEKLSQACNIPIIYITHSLEEVARLADYLVVMDEGEIVTKGELQEVLSRVDIPIILDNDLGAVLKAEVVEKDNKWHLMRAHFDGGDLWLKDNHLAIGDQLRLRILAKDVSLSLAPQDSSILNSLPAEVIEIVDDVDEAMSLVRLKAGNTILISRLTRRSVDHLSLTSGLAVWAQIKSVAILP
jgi:molybdate transport system ATP-binding protein